MNQKDQMRCDLNEDVTNLLNGDAETLLVEAARLRDLGHPRLQTWSAKVFIPLTQLCRNLCHYCTFSQPPRPGESAYLDREEVLEIARAGKLANCTEALFTLGDKPELRFASATAELDRLGHPTTIAYLAEMCAVVRDETGLLPHVNAGVMTRDELVTLRAVSASMGLMLESVADRLCEKGGPHYRSPDKAPAARLERSGWQESCQFHLRQVFSSVSAKHAKSEPQH
jgi:FO synthase